MPSSWSSTFRRRAFLGALATVCALVGLSSLRDLPPAGIILAGVAISSFFGSATMLLQYFATDVEIASAVFWTFGDLKKAQWPQLAVIAAALLPVAVILQRRSWHFNAMAWGDDTAKSLGVGVRPAVLFRRRPHHDLHGPGVLEQRIGFRPGVKLGQDLFVRHACRVSVD